LNPPNSPAVLIHWRALIELLGLMPAPGREALCSLRFPVVPDLAILFPTPLSHWLMGTPTPTDQMGRRHWSQTKKRHRPRYRKPTEWTPVWGSRNSWLGVQGQPLSRRSTWWGVCDRRLSPDLAILFPTPLSHWLMGTPTPTDQMGRRHWFQTKKRHRPRYRKPTRPLPGGQ
jgi:hypothetical protein